MEAINVFFWINGIDDRPGVELRGQGQLDDDAVDFAIAVEPGHQLEQPSLGDVGVAFFSAEVLVKLNADPAAGPLFVLRIAVRGGTLANQNGGQPRRGGEVGDVRLKLKQDGAGQLLAVDQFSGIRFCHKVEKTVATAAGDGRGDRG